MIPLPLTAIFTVLRGIPWWAYAGTALLAWGGWARHQYLSTKTEFNDAKASAAVARAASAAEAATTTALRERKQKEALDAKAKELERERAARAESAAAAERLRARLTSLEAGQRAGDSGAAISCEAAQATANLRADVRRRLDEATDSVAAYAGDAAAAGRACERSYDSLKAKP